MLPEERNESGCKDLHHLFGIDALTVCLSGFFEMQIRLCSRAALDQILKQGSVNKQTNHQIIKTGIALMTLDMLNAPPCV